MAGLFSGWFGGSKNEMPPPPGPSAVIVDPASMNSAGQIIEEELNKMGTCQPTPQLQRIIEILKDPQYLMTGGYRRRHRRSRHRRSSRRRGTRRG